MGTIAGNSNNAVTLGSENVSNMDLPQIEYTKSAN